MAKRPVSLVFHSHTIDPHAFDPHAFDPQAFNPNTFDRAARRFSLMKRSIRAISPAG